MEWAELTVQTTARVQFVDITSRVAAELKKHPHPQNGICYLYVPHTTAGVLINENADPDVMADLERGLEKIAPFTGDYRHAEGNSAAHIKASLIGFSIAIPLIEGSLALGTWQGIYFSEFDGPRRRRILIGIGGL